MLKTRLLRRLTVLFAVLTLCIWSASVVLTLRQDCSTLGDNYPFVSLRTYLHESVKGVVLQQNSSEISKWFWKQLPRHAEEEVLVQSACPTTHHDVDYTATLGAIGDLHLTLRNESTLAASAINSLSTISRLLKDSSAIVADLASVVPDENEESVNAVRALREIGVQLVSLANEHVLQTEDNVKLMPSTVHVLEAAGIRWLGLNAKHHEIVSINGMRVGVLAFCGVHGECIESSTQPYSPIKYSTKVAYAAFSEMKEHSVDAIIVLMHWGKVNSYYPDETAVVIARQLSERGANLVIGHHPNLVQDHAYFGDTLVLFSLGNLLSSEEVSSYCWHRAGDEWQYSTSDECQKVHPNNRGSLFRSEQQTRIYKIHLSRSYPPTADYITVPLETESMYPHVKRPANNVNESQLQWTRVCGDRDTHCLACEAI